MDDYEDDQEDPSSREQVAAPPSRPPRPDPSLLNTGALQGLFPETPELELPKSPVDPQRKWNAFAANVLRGSTLAEGLSHGMGAMVDQENKDSELYQRYLPLVMDAKAKRAAAKLQQQQIQQKMLSGWNTALLQNTSALLAQPGGVNPASVSQIVSGLVRSGQVPPQVAQSFVQQLPQDPEELRGYLSRAAIAAADPWRGVKAPTVKGVREGEKLVSIAPDGRTASTLLDNPKAKEPSDALMKFMKEANIDPNSTKGQQLIAQYGQKISSHAPPNQQTVIMKEENAEAKKVGEFHGEQYATLQKGGMEAQRKLATLARANQFLAKVNTGKLAPLLKDVAGYAQEFGIKLDPNLGDKEALESLTNEMAMQARNPSGGAGMPGAMSDSDREFLKNTVPGLSKTKNGNIRIIETMRQLARRDIEVAQLAAKYRAENGHIDTGFQTYLQKWSDANPMFSPATSVAPKSANIQDLVDQSKRK